MPTPILFLERTTFLPVLAGALLVVTGCAGTGGASGEANRSEKLRPIDEEATEETTALYANLGALANEHVLFGHQADLAYGVHWDRRSDSLARAAGDRRSDVKSVTGSYPAVYGWDVGDISQPEAAENLDGVPFDKMKNWIVEGHERGGVITVSWHMNNLVSGGSAWDTTPAVSKLLPDSSHHEAYRRALDRFAAFAKDVEAGFWSWIGGGHPVPIIFRPFHEMTGGWFWWGGDNTTPAAYKRLWRFTVEYLRDEKEVHNLLYAYSPDIIESKADYLRYYPGDAYVDILGYDDYHTLPATFADTMRVDTVAVDTRSLAAADTVAVPEPTAGRTVLTDTVAADTAAGPPVVRRTTVDSVRIPPDTIEARAATTLAERFRTVVQLADEHGKVPTYTETGYEGIPDSTWWTDRLLPVLTSDSTTRRLAYVLVWRNANNTKKPGHFFAPYPGHPSARNFVRFRNDPLIYFEDELPPMYALPK